MQCKRRLQPPKREDAAAKASFKPGAATWNTDDPAQAPPGQRPGDRKKPSAAAAAADKKAAEKKAGEKQAPQPYLTDAKYTTDEFRTSGGLMLLCFLESLGMRVPAALTHELAGEIARCIIKAQRSMTVPVMLLPSTR